jgi:hypothetical protein
VPTTVHSASPSRELSEDQALARAQATGKPVQATAATTATSTLTANPDGTLTLSQNLTPVRKLVHGTWQGLDATLVRSADGTISPKVSTSSLILSGGGTGGPLATMRSGDGSLAVSLPSAFALHAPTLAGATATYPSVLPGVDLTVTAQTSGGFSEVLVVKNATAAKNPALAELQLATKATGVTLASDKAGDLTAKDRRGQVVFSAPAPTMWDSTPAAANTPKATNPATGQRIDARDGTPLASDSAQAGAGARKGGLKAAYRAGRITLTADKSILTGATTHYPVFMDPSFTASGQTDPVQAWAFVDNYWPDNAYWKPGSSTPGPLHVGYEGWETPYSTNRAFFRTSIHSGVWDAKVISSDISFYENYSPSCTAEPVDLYWTGSISSGTTWNNQPQWISKLGSDNVAYGWSTSCGPHDVTFPITSTMQSAANGHWSNATFGLQADNESDMYGWKQFSNQATITTTYDHAPSTPKTLTTSPTTSCSASSPTVLGVGDVTLHAAVSDPDGTTSPLTANFTLKNMSSGATSAQAVNATSGTTVSALYSHTSTSGPFQALTARTEFAWYLTVTDQYMTSSQSATCHFYYDPTAPGAPTITPVTSTTSQCNDLSTDSTDNLCTIGTTAGFTITDTNSSTNVPTSYVYQLNGAAPATATASPSSPYTATIYVKPTEQTNTLTVTAVASGGNTGDAQDLQFIAHAPATAANGDLNGDGHADLVTVGGQNTLPAGLWQAAGDGAGQLTAQARNIGINGNGVSTSQTPTSFNGTQTVVGHYFTGAGFNDVLDYGYNAGTGAVSAELLRGQGDGSTLNPVDSLPVTNSTGVFTVNQSVTNPDGTTTTTTSYATSVGNGGGLYNTVNGYPVTGYPDLLLLINGSLYDEAANNGTGSYPGADQAADIADVNPYCLAQNTANGNTSCTTGWNGWTIASTLVGGVPALFARDTSTSTSDPSAGQLWYLTPSVLNTLTYDSLANGAVDTSATGLVQAATSGWDSTAVPTLQAADINGDGTPDLWSVNAAGGVTAHLMTLSGTTAAWTTRTSQTLSTATHSWPLNDGTADAVTTAADTANGTALPLTASSTGATWYGRDLFTPDLALDGVSGSLHTSAPGVTTSGDFTVSVWADPQAISSAGGAVLSQDGSQDSGFVLRALSTGWSFCMAKADSGGWNDDCATSKLPVRLGAWTHLTATYSHSTGEMALYLNGVSDATGTHTAVSGFTGAFQVGEDLVNGARSAYFNGDLSQIQTWNKVLSPAEVLAADADGANTSATLFTSNGYQYPSGSTWTQAGATMAFNQGLLTVVAAGTQLYSLGKAGYPNAVLTLQTDGNLVIYDNAADAALANGTGALGSSGTNSHSGDAMLFQPDGNLVIYDAYGTSLWDSNTDVLGADQWQLTNSTGGGDLTGANPATTSPTVTWGANHDGTANAAAGLNGTDGVIRATGPAVSTTGSYTVTAWVKLNNLSNTQNVVSQASNNHQAFYLGYDQTSSAWYFMTTTSDDSSTSYPKVTGGSAQAGEWTQLAAVYDHGTGTMTLYVDGTSVGTAANSTPVASAGPLQIGASSLPASPTTLYNPVNGFVSDVRVYPSALTGAQIQMSTNEPDGQGRYTFGDTVDWYGNGTQDVITTDSSGNLWVIPTGQHTSNPTRTQIGTSWGGYTIAGAADLNKDGHTDVVALDSTGNLWFYPGTSTGALGSRVQIGTGWGSYSFAGVRDWNGDGIPDVVAKDSSGNLWMYPGTGTGTLGSRVQIGTGWQNYTLDGLTDWDKDGHTDVVATDSSGNLWLYPGDANHDTATARVSLGTGWTGYTIAGLQDVTGDGNPDIITRSPADTLFAYPGTGTRTGPGIRTLVGVNW